MRKTNTPPLVYYKYQKVFEEVANEMDTPVIWNTQRQMGKSTILAKLAAKYLKRGDVWMVGPNNHTEEEFIKKVIDQIPGSAPVRKTRSRIELATEEKINFLGSPSKFKKGETYNQPKLIIVDELAYVSKQRFENLIPYITPEPKHIKFVAVTTGITEENIEWVEKKFGTPEVITTAFESINIWMEDLLGKSEDQEILRT